MFDDVGKGGLAAGVGLGVVLLGTPVWFLGAVGAWWWLREPPTAAPVPYAFAVPPADAVRDGVDWLALHRVGWPAVVTARTPDARAAAVEAVRQAVADDEGLRSLVDPLGAALDAADASTTSDAAEVWNAALAARGVPFALQGGGNGSYAWVKGYWLAAVPTVRAGDRATTVRVGLRVDRLNVVEGWLGLAEDVGGAIVVVDRVRDFAVEDLWPRLDPDDPRPASAAVRADVAARLPPDLAAALVAAAPAQRALRDAVTAVEARQACGSTFVLRVPWSGVDDFAGLRAWAAAGAGERCPGLTDDEADALIAGTTALRASPELPAALGALTALAARHVALHEARHRLDQEDWGFGTPPPRAAGTGLSDRATIEASAYLSSLASPEAVLAWTQACDVLGSGAGGSPGEALRRLEVELDAPCDAPPPPDLADRARAVEASWFGPRPALGLDDLPAALPLGLHAPEDP